MSLGKFIGPRSKTARGCKCPKGTVKNFVQKYGLRCKGMRIVGGRKRAVFIKMPKKCNK